VNLSGHLPINVKIDLNFVFLTQTSKTDDNLHNQCIQFDRKCCNKQDYYDVTGLLCNSKICQLYSNIELLKENDHEVFHKLSLQSLCTRESDPLHDAAYLINSYVLIEINNIYEELVSVLQLAASETIPFKRVNIEEFWWNE